MGGGVLVVVAGGQLSRPERTRSFPFVCSSLLIQTGVTSYRQNSCAVFFSPFLGTLLSGDSVMGCVCVSDEGPHTHTHTYTRVGRRRGRGGCWARFQSLCCALLVGRCLLVTGLAVWSLTARCRLSDSWDMESSGSGSDECVPLRPAARLPRRPKRGRRSGEAREAWLERTERPDGIPDLVVSEYVLVASWQFAFPLLSGTGSTDTPAPGGHGLGLVHTEDGCWAIPRPFKGPGPPCSWRRGSLQWRLGKHCSRLRLDCPPRKVAREPSDMAACSVE